MAFKNLEERFNSKMGELYQGTARQLADGGMTRDPIIEKKPSEKNTDYGDDTRAFPIRSVVTDLERMTKWSTSPEGLKWYVVQGALQAGNTFSHTRLYNPAFVVGNVQPYPHVMRAWRAPNAVDLTRGAPDASVKNIGSAGRLQIQTATSATSRLLTIGKGASLLTSVLGSLQSTVTQLSGTVKPGVLQVNERPELQFPIDATKKGLYSEFKWRTLKQDLVDNKSEYLVAPDGSVTVIPPEIPHKYFPTTVPSPKYLDTKKTGNVLLQPAGFGPSFVNDGTNVQGKAETSVNGRKRYFFDVMNTSEFNPSSPIPQTEIPASLIEEYRKKAPTLVDFIIFDYVNKVSIPFRALLSGITETVVPEHKDVFYIGRTERNIVYLGTRRSLSFKLNIHAFSDDELEGVWKKVNYITGLCYPSKYINGFMAPSLIKFTLGNIYDNQPAYIKAATTTIEEDVSWSVDDTWQVPHGVSLNLTFELIEKGQPQTNYDFYSFGKTRSENTGQLSTTRNLISPGTFE